MVDDKNDLFYLNFWAKMTSLVQNAGFKSIFTRNTYAEKV